MKNRGNRSGQSDFLVGGGEMGRLIRSMDWSPTPLGSAESWAQSLRTTVSLCLPSSFPMCIAWGPKHVMIYNDGYWPICAGKHPGSMGQDFSECWASAWPVIGEPFARALAGHASFIENTQMFLDRNGYLEETFFTFSFSPIRDETGGVGGILNPCHETTARMLSERRARALRDLAARTGKAKSVGDVYALTAQTLKDHDLDVPFTLLYEQDSSHQQARLIGSAGLEPGAEACPDTLDLECSERSIWPVAEVFRSGSALQVDDVSGRLGLPPYGPYPEPPRTALLLPIMPPGAGRPTIVLAVGVSPRLPLNEAYRDFYDLLAAGVTAAIANARAYEGERKRAEALAELDRAKTAFFSNVSHEFRTPLTLMLGPIEDILAQPEAQVLPENRELLTVVHRNALRLQKLVNTLLDFSRIEAGRVQALYEPTDLAAVTAELASNFRSACERAGLSLVVDCPRLPKPVYVDREMWEKIVLNLVSNAFKFTVEGEITVALRQARDGVELVVSDTGTGIAPEELPHVFERFHRAKDTRGRTHEGTGIGLALVHELVKLHGGSVDVASTPNRGTTFTVAIPFGASHLPADRIGVARTGSSPAPASASYAEEALRWLGEPAPFESELAVTQAKHAAHVLVADDNADMRDYVSRLLRQHWHVTAVSDGQAALDSIRERHPDLIVADVMMPRLGGFGLLRSLRGQSDTANVPVILLSARAGEESRVEGLDAGADDYLVKPFAARELVARVNAHLELARVRKESLRREQTARAQAEQANRAKDAFLATLSHELRTPLNAILGWAAILNSGQADATAQKRGLEVIERNAKVQTQLIEDMLDVSRIITGKMRLDVRAVDLIGVVNAAIDSVRPAAAARDVRLERILDPKAGPIAGDSDRLQQVMWNLLSNAIKFTPKGGRVQIRLERIDSHIEAVVSDTGCGIAPDVLPAVFDRFMQADSSSSRRHGGLGLGLALVKHLVELHGGTVRAESGGVDLGTTFTVQLPLMARVADPAAREHPTARRLAAPAMAGVLVGRRLLVVDDEADTLELFAKILSEQGADVSVATNADEALEHLTYVHPDALICDIEMPGEDGYSLIKRVRSLAPEAGGSVPAVAVTAYGSVDDRIRVLSAGFQMHVPKPVEPAELVTVVASLAAGTHR